MGYVEYSSNNSGGSWWLKDEDWQALEKAGWKVVWAWLGHEYVDSDYVRDEDGTPKLVVEHDEDYRFIDAIASCAYRVGLPIREAVREWEEITGGDPYDAGCSCCGQPHDFSEYDDEFKYVGGGPEPTNKCEW